jgi:hypothetical protein
MNRSQIVRLVIGTALACAAGALCAQQALEIIPLRYATVEQVLPVLQPLVEPGGTLSGSRGQLFLRASAGNVDEIKRALAAIDRPAKSLVISVRSEDTSNAERRALGAAGSVGSGGARIVISGQDSRRALDERVDQQVRVLEGGRAMISTGWSGTYRDLSTGFEVVPRLAGGGVTLEIYQRSPVQAAATTVAGRLGEWIEIGGTGTATAQDARGIASTASVRRAESQRVWVKVEESRN